MPGRASTDWLVTIVSYVPKLRYASRKVGRCRYERMSRYLAGSVMPGCGRQSREVGAHGKIESNSATGSWAFKAIDATGVERHLTSNSQTLSARALGSPSSILVRSRP